MIYACITIFIFQLYILYLEATDILGRRDLLLRV